MFVPTSSKPGNTGANIQIDDITVLFFMELLPLQ